ncbi:hypothetical protein L914_00244 [Phytophthora nicotianae]|uniref:Uncharacterized protein n=2 Tax=Phytophthora nicotianae TaxID=4792 RepID=V9G304_PHYNI|nr:hypothetical protein F443_00280 [Phytophthora nicotianae P1569]ETM56849.1 hypothetical protein L914_00244 [Phytophthora nicotianae]
MRARCLTPGEDYNTATRSVKDSFDRLRTEIDNIINSGKNQTLPDVQALFRKELHFNLKESGVSERVLKYFISCERIIEEHGLHGCFEFEAGSKEKCCLLINSITPEALKEEVKNALCYESPDAKSDKRKLHDLILAKALEQDREFRQSKRKRILHDVEAPHQIHKWEEKRMKSKDD